MRSLSKSKLLSFRQCPRRLWLEIHQPKLCQNSDAAQARFMVGHQVGEIARQIYDPKNRGVTIDAQRDGYASALASTTQLLSASAPIFEAGFSAEGAIAFADVMLPSKKGGKKSWRMVEVKSSTSVKDYHRDDAAIQSFVAKAAGVPLSGIALAHIDNEWVYPGNEDYAGILVEEDLTDEAFVRHEEVKQWIRGAQAVVGEPELPSCRTGRQCNKPNPCGFLEYCQSLEPKARYPVSWLPGPYSKAVSALIESGEANDMRDIPDDLLNDRLRKIKSCTLSGKVHFDAAGAAASLAGCKLPAYFLDFETIQFAIPIWKGTRPYRQIPFQFSLHRLSRTGKLEHSAFLDLSGGDPSRAFAEALIGACGERGPIFVYNEGFEKSRIKELAERFPRMRRDLLALNERVVDLLPIAQAHYYHPSQQGSWSIKSVLPALVPDLSYDKLEGVQNGGMAMNAYMEAIAPGTTAARKTEIHDQLMRYCELDTYSMVRIWWAFSGRDTQF